MRRIFVAFIGFLLLTGAAHADVDVRTAEPGAAPPPAKIEQFAWLAGTWVGRGLGGEVDEAYSAPVAGAMIGYFRLVKDGKPVFYEMITLFEDAGSVLLRLKHFHPDLVGWEEKDKSVDFKLLAVEGQTAHFHGLTFKREGDVLLCALALRFKDGTRKIEQFRYTLKK
jgi:hypothetical protein